MARALVRAIARFAADLGIATTAEGVETREQLECVAAAGIGEAQGYYYSRPVPAAEVVRLIARDRPALAQTGRIRSAAPQAPRPSACRTPAKWQAAATATQACQIAFWNLRLCQRWNATPIE